MYMYYYPREACLAHDLLNSSAEHTPGYTLQGIRGKHCTVKSVLKDHPIGHKNVVCQDRWSLVTGSVIL